MRKVTNLINIQFGEIKKGEGSTITGFKQEGYCIDIFGIPYSICNNNTVTNSACSE